MRRIVTLMMAVILLACSNTKPDEANQQEKLYDFQIKVTSTESYCGGARPSEEMLEELRTPVPASDVKVFLRKGETNDIDSPVDYSFVSDREGMINGKLPEGAYSVVFENKKDKETFNNLIEKYEGGTANHSPINEECLKEHFALPEGKLVVREIGKNEVTVNKKKNCPWTEVPCSEYKKSLPPVAPPR